MRGMPLGLADKGLREVEAPAAAAEDLWKVICGHAPTLLPTTTSSAGVAKKEGFEPRSVLDHGRSPSPPTSASTFSSSLGVGGGDPPAFPMEDWEGVAVAAGASPGPEQSLLGWAMGEIPMDFEAGDGGVGLGLVDPAFGSMAAPPPLASSVPVAPAGEFSEVDANNGIRVLPVPPGLVPLPPPPGAAFQGPTMEEKPHCFGPNLLLSHQQQEDLLLLPPHPKRHQSMADHQWQNPKSVPFRDTGQDLLQWRHQQQQQCLESFHVLPHHLRQLPMKPNVGISEAAGAAAQHQQLLLQQQEEPALVYQLFKAAELVEAGNFADARVVLARLNHQLSPLGNPLVRSAFYCKEALHSIITNNSYRTGSSTLLPLQRNPPAMVLPTPLDVLLKLSAYKAFSEISPILQFTNFTCTQAFLEELGGCSRIHVVDFDIGIGGQWSSFMLDLAQRRRIAADAAPSLKITAVAPLSFNHSFELALTRENLSHFAGGLNIPFEFNVLNNDPLELSSLLNTLQSDEAIAVNLPLNSAYPSIPNILHLVKQLSPKILVSVDHGWEHNGLMFSNHFLHLLQSATILLDSIDAAGISPVIASKIERYLLQPKIENAILGHHSASVKGLPWRTLFASAGFTAVPFSRFTEAQAECLLKRTHVRGFLLEKHQSSLLLHWHNGVLVSVSAWKC